MKRNNFLYVKENHTHKHTQTKHTTILKIYYYNIYISLSIYIYDTHLEEQNL